MVINEFTIGFEHARLNSFHTHTHTIPASGAIKINYLSGPSTILISADSRPISSTIFLPSRPRRILPRTRRGVPSTGKRSQGNCELHKMHFLRYQEVFRTTFQNEAALQSVRQSETRQLIRCGKLAFI